MCRIYWMRNWRISELSHHGWINLRIVWLPVFKMGSEQLVSDLFWTVWIPIFGIPLYFHKTLWLLDQPQTTVFAFAWMFSENYRSLRLSANSRSIENKRYLWLSLTWTSLTTIRINLSSSVSGGQMSYTTRAYSCQKYNDHLKNRANWAEIDQALLIKVGSFSSFSWENCSMKTKLTDF